MKKRQCFRMITLFLYLMLFLSSCYHEGNETKKPSETSEDTGSSLTLSEKLQVPDHYQAKFVSDTGITTIHVDAEVIVPKTSRVDVIEAIPRPFTDEEIQSFIKRHTDDLTWIDHATKGPYNGHGPQPDSHFQASELGYQMYSLWIYNEEEFNAGRDYHSISIHYGLNTRTGKLAFKPQLEYIKSRYDLGAGASDLLPLIENKALGCSISLKEARTFADKEVKAICPDYDLTACGQMPVFETINNPQYYIFRYTRHINGMPVNDCYGGEDTQSDYDYTSGLGVITVIVDDEGICYLKYENPYDLGPVIQSDCKLLPFSQIMDIFSKVGLLSIQHLERSEDLLENTMDVYKIQLGYMAVRQPDHIDAYYYIPVWDFYAHRVLYGTGGYAHGKDFPKIWGLSELTINAIDGTIIDRKYGY